MNPPPPQTRHLLVVDDDFANRILPGLFMRERGWQVTECGSADEAQGLLKSGLITHVLLDISLPRVSGLQFCRQLRANAVPGRLYIYAYTAHAMQYERDSFVQAGFDGILLKPIRQQQLLDVLEPGVSTGD
jgi:CheY-like chemotaxis protein